MKTKLVLWGEDMEDNKVLIAFQLRAEDNLVDVWTFHGEEASMDLHNRLLYEWREGKETAFPVSGFQHHPIELSVAESILPENIKTDKSDLVSRAQTEWHFVVLSTKLYRAYQGELDDLKEKIESLTEYDPPTWEILKGFWDKVREQVRERNLSRHHADTLRDQTNKLFSQMKELNALHNATFNKQAQKTYDEYAELMERMDLKIQSEDNLARIFDELKEIQKRFRKEKLTRELRSKLWERIDNAFKTVKLKRFGPEAAKGNSAVERLQRRLDGLMNALKKMQRSISRDEEELKFQIARIEDSETGQLESQIREAKLKMIEERIKSKEEKLADMNSTREQLEKQLEQLKAKEEKKPRPEKKAESNKESKSSVKENGKEKIAIEDKADSSESAADKKVVVPVAKEAKPEEEEKKEPELANEEEPVSGEAEQEKEVNPEVLEQKNPPKEKAGDSEVLEQNNSPKEKAGDSEGETGLEEAKAEVQNEEEE